MDRYICYPELDIRKHLCPPVLVIWNLIYYLVFYMYRYLCYPVLDIWRNLCPPVLVIWNPIYYLVFYIYLCYPVLGIWRNLCPSGTLYTTLSLTYTSTYARHMEASIYYPAFDLNMYPGHIDTLPIQAITSAYGRTVTKLSCGLEGP